MLRLRNTWRKKPGTVSVAICSNALCMFLALSFLNLTMNVFLRPPLGKLTERFYAGETQSRSGPQKLANGWRGPEKGFRVQRTLNLGAHVYVYTFKRSIG